MVAIEAQCSGIPCVLSTEVTKDAKINENVKRLPLAAGAKEWAMEIFSLLSVNVELSWLTDWDIRHQVSRLANFYYDETQIN